MLHILFWHSFSEGHELPFWGAGLSQAPTSTPAQVSCVQPQTASHAAKEQPPSTGQPFIVQDWLEPGQSQVPPFSDGLALQSVVSDPFVHDGLPHPHVALQVEVTPHVPLSGMHVILHAEDGHEQVPPFCGATAPVPEVQFTGWFPEQNVALQLHVASHVPAAPHVPLTGVHVILHASGEQLHSPPFCGAIALAPSKQFTGAFPEHDVALQLHVASHVPGSPHVPSTGQLEKRQETSEQVQVPPFCGATAPVPEVQLTG
jgi:hypothetical protein